VAQTRVALIRGTVFRFGGDVNCLYQTIAPVEKLDETSLAMNV
jgi:hypothetical protein